MQIALQVERRARPQIWRDALESPLNEDLMALPPPPSTFLRLNGEEVGTCAPTACCNKAPRGVGTLPATTHPSRRMSSASATDAKGRVTPYVGTRAGLVPPGPGSATPARSQVQLVKPPMQRKFIFLDVDGVLHPSLSGMRQRRGSAASMESGRSCVVPAFVPKCMFELKRVVTATGAQIILSSSWRLKTSRRSSVDKALQKHKIPCTIGVTPAINKARSRGSEIKQWLSDNTSPFEDLRWVAIDDFDMLADLGSLHMVRTNKSCGISEWDAEDAICLLNDLPRKPRPADDYDDDDWLLDSIIADLTEDD